ncbi:MarR family transcriptional regulator [Clostridioides mangenotii]|uniref:MarR family winged helix-turn-helix transcriptional regulator n=1 Tax=Metaclostridioides mangenotii TaxID=1540 RepID=UPI002149A6FA|nr:MarR family transcriptional regulator [Clostridioides mangenotii]MCR1955016.1 MarR family transcriptional regulator [Clostridioides mangenotii]
MKTKNNSYGKENDLNLKTLIALTRSTNKLNRRSNTVFRNHGLSTMQFAVLEVLYHKGDLRIGEIIEKILATGGNMTVVINNLVKEGMVEKYTDPKDSRSNIIHITDKGKSKIEEIFPEHLLDLDDFLKNISSEEKHKLIDILKKLSV